MAQLLSGLQSWIQVFVSLFYFFPPICKHPKKKKTGAIFSKSKKKMKNKDSQSMVVDATNKACDISPLIRANNQTVSRVHPQEERHHAVTIISFTVFQVIHIPGIFCNQGQVFYVPISLYRKSVIQRKKKKTTYLVYISICVSV